MAEPPVRELFPPPPPIHNVAIAGAARAALAAADPDAIVKAYLRTSKPFTGEGAKRQLHFVTFLNSLRVAFLRQPVQLRDLLNLNHCCIFQYSLNGLRQSNFLGLLPLRYCPCCD